MKKTITISSISLAITSYIIYSLYINLGTNLDYEKLSAISTSVASIGTLVLLIFTIATYLFTQYQGKLDLEPIVTVRIKPDESNHSFLNLHVKNTGKGEAYDLNIVFNPDIEYGENTLNILAMFQRTYLLEKNEEIRMFLGSAAELFNLNDKTLINVKLTYHTLPKEYKRSKKISRTIKLKLDERRGQLEIVKYDIHKLVEEFTDLKHFLILNLIEKNNEAEKENKADNKNKYEELKK